MANRRRHSLLAQQRQFDRLAALPPSQRFGCFLDDIYGPICDMLSRAGEVLSGFRAAHRRSLSIKEMLKAHSQDASKTLILRGEPVGTPSTARIVRFPSQDSAGKNER